MRKLYENIEDIYIKGSPAELTSIITAMDISLQNISEGTEQLAAKLVKYSDSNKGTQYERIVARLLALRDVLYQASVDLNGMQNEIVAYQNKIFRYEDMAELASTPNPHMVQRINIHVEVSLVQFNLAEMMSVSAELRNYSEAIVYHTQNLLDSKDQAATIWLDSQYTIFAQFIDDVCKEIISALKVFDEYILVLEEKIKELN